MGYVVLALGVLMAAVGLDAIATGYPIIQVERGWATVISGSVMLTGGLVTVALGFAVRTLGEIRAALRAQSGPAVEAVPAAARLEPTQAIPQVAIPQEAIPQVTPAVSLPAHDPVPTLAGTATAAAALNATEPLTHDAHGPLHDEQQRDEPGFAETPLPAAEPTPSWLEPKHHPADAAKADEPTPDGYELQSPSTPEHDIAPAEPPHAPSPTDEEDWLDRALSDFEAGLSPTHPAEVLAPEHVSNAAEDAAAIQAEVPPIHPEPAATAPAEAEPRLIEPPHAEEAHAQPVDAEPAPPIAEPQAPPAHEPAPHDLAVIGRYESDGTSYVMYADGSIEAQSEAGVYRFRSMAELKAFIED